MNDDRFGRVVIRVVARPAPIHQGLATVSFLDQNAIHDQGPEKYSIPAIRNHRRKVE